MKNDAVNTERISDTFTDAEGETYTGSAAGWIAVVVILVAIVAIAGYLIASGLFGEAV